MVDGISVLPTTLNNPQQLYGNQALYTKLKEHEQLKSHSHSAEAYMVYKSKTMLENVVGHASLNKHVADINYRHCVLVTVIESIKFIG